MYNDAIVWRCKCGKLMIEEGETMRQTTVEYYCDNDTCNSMAQDDIAGKKWFSVESVGITYFDKNEDFVNIVKLLVRDDFEDASLDFCTWSCLSQKLHELVMEDS